MVLTAEGKCVYVPLRPAGHCSEIDQTTIITSDDWIYDDKELERAFTSKTKLLILNTPHNPLGKIFTEKELCRIADLCIKNNVVCISDEVYEFITFDKPHVRIGMKLI